MPEDPKLLAALITVISVALSSGVSAIVTLFLAHRSRKQEREKSLIEYLKNKIAKLEIAKAEIFDTLEGIENANGDVAAAAATYAENNYKIARKSLSTIGHYINGEVTLRLENNAEKIGKSLAYHRAISKKIATPEQWTGDRANLFEPTEIVSAMTDLLINVQSQVSDELRDAIGDIERLGGL